MVTEEEIEKLKKDWQELMSLLRLCSKGSYEAAHQSYLIEQTDRAAKLFRWAVIDYTGGNWTEKQLKAKGWILPNNYSQMISIGEAFALYEKHGLDPHPARKYKVRID